MANEKDHVAGLAIQIPEKFIADQIRAAVVAAIPDKEKLIETLVRKAMEEKNPGSYGSETRFDAAVKEMIVNEAKAVMQEWLAQSKDKIRASLKKELERRHAQHITAIAQKLADGVASIYVGNISLALGDK